MKQYKLGEISEILTGSTPSTKDKDNYGGDIIWVTPKDLSDQNSKYFYQGARNITQKGLKECGAKIIPANSILMSSRAPIGLLAINKVECCTNQGFKSIVLDKSLADENYLYYYLKYHINEIHALGSGTTFREVSKPTLERYEIKIHDLPEQRKIGQVLSSIDDKIAVNNRINALFEQVARAVYEYYFIQFDFPDKQGKPYKQNGGVMTYNKTLHRQIPKHFEVKTIENIEAQIVTGKTPATAHKEYYNGSIPFITIDDIRQNTFITKTASYLTTLGADTQNNKYLPANSICVSCIATVGLVGLTTEISQTNQQINSIICSNEENLYYLYFAIKDYFKFSFGAKTGNIVKNMNKGDFSNILLIYPNNDLLKKYHSIVMPFFNQMKVLTLENQNLKALRDFLLPLLMNEQARI